MAETSAIEWTDSTWNPVTGCTRVSPGCAHCYIETTIPFRTKHRKFERVGNEETTGLQLHPERLAQPLSWRRPRRVFVNSLSDLFHEEIPDEFIARVFDVMEEAEQHTFQVLTKRPERALAWFRDPANGNATNAFEKPLPNVWIGVSIENARFTWRADVLRVIPAAVRFISAEPLLGSLLAPGLLTGRVIPEIEALPLRIAKPLDLTGIDWLIVGGESGGKFARPMHPDWARELRDACIDPSLERWAPDGEHAPAFFFKQWGSWSPQRPKHVKPHGVASMHPDGTVATSHGPDPTRFLESTSIYYHGASAKSGGRELDGRTWDEMPHVERAAGGRRLRLLPGAGVTREMYAMDLGRGMGVAGRVVDEVVYVDGNPRTIRITWTNGETTSCDGHDRIAVDEFTPQRIARLENAQRLIDGEGCDVAPIDWDAS